MAYPKPISKLINRAIHYYHARCILIQCNSVIKIMTCFSIAYNLNMQMRETE